MIDGLGVMAFIPDEEFFQISIIVFEGMFRSIKVSTIGEEFILPLDMFFVFFKVKSDHVDQPIFRVLLYIINIISIKRYLTS